MPVIHGVVYLWHNECKFEHPNALNLEKPGRRQIFQHSIDPKHAAKGSNEKE